MDVETFRVYCYCPKPDLDENNVCRNCGTKWKRDEDK